MPRFRLSTLILATSLIAIAWACAVLPWVTVGQTVSYIKPGELVVIQSTKRPPNAGEIAIRMAVITSVLFATWGGLRILLRGTPAPCSTRLDDGTPADQ